jgi:hypothetical protein
MTRTLRSREDAMDVGVQMVFASYGRTDISDEQVWDEELRLARVAADSGFDVLWSVEHHFRLYAKEVVPVVHSWRRTAHAAV